MTSSDIGGTFADDARRYRLDSRIATGGMGEVWRATDTVLNREVAVKVLKHEYADDPTFRSRFETEARHAAALHHPGVAGVYDFGEATATDGSGQPRPYLVMELVEGQPLSRLIADGRDLDRSAVRDLLAQAGDALAAAHAAGIVHRDVKPANLMVTPDGKIKITDFGIARAGDGAGITQTGTVMGTAQYLSPEQARGELATPASDVYALGVVGFECLAGRRPFEADSQVATALAHIQQPVPDLPADVPSDLAAVVLKALSKDPADRYPDGAAFAAALRGGATAGIAVPPAVVPPVEPGSDATQVIPATSGQPATPPVPPTTDRKKGRSKAVWLVPLIVLLLVAAIVIAAVALNSGDDDNEPPPADDTSEPTKSPPTTEPTTPPTTEPTTPPPPPTTEPTTPPTTEPTTPPTTPTTPPTTPTTPPTTPTTPPTTPTEPTLRPPTSPASGAPTTPEGEGN
ncbi:MAG TPA: serine/threonine-protein kinase [Nocardioides sp.]|nr:serine/threonine-protein kinase [Nocardioides sp.]